MRKTLFTITMVLCVATLASVASIIAKNSNNERTPDSINGVISDKKCGATHESAYERDKLCVQKCLKNGEAAVLISDGRVYQLDQTGQEKAREFAGEKVEVTGNVSGDSISVTSIKRQ